MDQKNTLSLNSQDLNNENMNTEEKLQQLVDRLLVKTQDNLCVWRKIENNKYTLQTPTANIKISYNAFDSIFTIITLEIVKNDIILSTTSKNYKDQNSNLVRLYDAVYEYHQNYVSTFLDDILIEIQKK